MSDLVGFEAPKVDWSSGPDHYARLKRFRQRCELLFEGPLKPHDGEQKCNYLTLWTGGYGLDLYNTWNLSNEQKKRYQRILGAIRRTYQAIIKFYSEPL